jgi:hypothetical protein
MCLNHISDMAILREHSNQQNTICLEIMDRPQVRSSKVEFLLLVIVVCFDSYLQLFKPFNQ